MKTRRTVVIILIIIIVIVAILNALYLKTDGFWSMTLSNCLTLITALVVSYFFTQRNQDERRQKEAYLKIIEKTQIVVSDKGLFCINSDTDINNITMKKRTLNNYITLLKKYAKKYDIQEEVQFIEERAKEYTDFMGNHNDDIPYLVKSQNDLKRPLDLVDSKLSEIMMKIFS